MLYTLSLDTPKTNSLDRVAAILSVIAGVEVQRDVPLARLARFGMGGPAAVVAEAKDPKAFAAALDAARMSDCRWVVLGGGTNLIADDAGFAGVALRFRGQRMFVRGNSIWVEAGVELEALVDAAVDAGLDGLHTMKRIPGWVGGAIYGNAGAYGHSIHEFVQQVQYLEDGRECTADHAACEFAYRHSSFKVHKQRVVIAAELKLPRGDADVLLAKATEIQRLRDGKYPPAMRCAGSIFKNFLAAQLPAEALDRVPQKSIIEGKVPSAWFLEQVGAKGMRRGDIQVADYHANLIYNDGRGKSADFRSLVGELKRRVLDEFGVVCEEEVQYVG
jgi:UDP-N-acetylmuramate dehydrogenase